jgi:uncharacterized Fe-S cluster protein YjdI
MGGKLQTYDGQTLSVTFDPGVCVHAGNCVRGLPAVFDVKRRPWIEMKGADESAIEAQVARCPSGALKVQRRTDTST